MQNQILFRSPRHRRIVLASAAALPVWAQQASRPLRNPRAPSSAAAAALPGGHHPMATPREGFWGRVNPFAGKKWVKKQTDPINDRLFGAGQLNASNARDIQDVDARAQAGIRKAQTSGRCGQPDRELGQPAGAQRQQHRPAGVGARGPAEHDGERSGPISAGHGPRRSLPRREPGADGRIEGQAGSSWRPASPATKATFWKWKRTRRPQAAPAFRSSQRLAEAVKRYLVTEHQIPVYRMHYVALGNAQAPATGDAEQKPERVRVSSVHVRLMENSLAAQAEAHPQKRFCSSWRRAAVNRGSPSPEASAPAPTATPP